MTKIHNRSIIFVTVELKFTCGAILLSWFWPERASIIWLCFFGIKLPCVNPKSLHADSQWIVILKTFELEHGVWGNSMLNVIDSLLMPYISLISTWDCYAVFEAWCKKKIENSFFSLFVLLALLLINVSDGFVSWSHQSVTGLISQRQFAPKC